MELRSLQILLKIAEAGSMSQAAVALGLTQSSLSRVVAALEEELGGPIFFRTGRGVSLTEIGESLVPAARQVVLGAEQLVADVRDRASEPSGLVTVAMMPTVTGVVAEPLFDAVRRAHPRITLRMLEGFSASIAQWLADGRVDIGIVSRFGESVGVGDDLLSTSNMMLVGGRSTAFKGRSVPFRQLARLPLVLPAPPNGTRVALDRIARKMGLELSVVVETDSLEAQKAIVERHECFTILDPKTIEGEVARNVFRARIITAPKIVRRVVVTATRHRPLGRAARHVMAIVRMLKSRLQ